MIPEQSSESDVEDYFEDLINDGYDDTIDYRIVLAEDKFACLEYDVDIIPFMHDVKHLDPMMHLMISSIINEDAMFCRNRPIGMPYYENELIEWLQAKSKSELMKINRDFYVYGQRKGQVKTQIIQILVDSFGMDETTDLMFYAIKYIRAMSRNPAYNQVFLKQLKSVM